MGWIHHLFPIEFANSIYPRIAEPIACYSGIFFFNTDFVKVASKT